MVSNKRKAWEEAVERGLIDEEIVYYDITEKEILLILEEEIPEIPFEEEEDIQEEKSEEPVATHEIVEVPECDSCGKEGIDRGNGDYLCDECYNATMIPEYAVEEDDIVIEEGPDIVPSIKITRNGVVGNITTGTVVTFKCKPGSNIRNYSGDMGVGFIVKKADRIRTYTGPLTKKLKKEIMLKKIILLR